VIACFTNTQRMIRNERWKLARYPKAKRDTALRSAKRSAGAAQPRRPIQTSPETRNKLNTALSQWLRENGDRL